MSAYHKGEKQIQALAGATLQASQLNGMVQGALAPAAVQFLLGQRLAAVTTRDKNGAVWVSAVVGEPGFVYPISPVQIILDARTLAQSDPLWSNLKGGQNQAVGMVVINFGQRRRLRVNGTASVDGDFVVMDVVQTYGNCPKYIQKRELVHAPDAASTANVRSSQTADIREEDKVLIGSSDTFFIGTYAAEGGADASHRGGQTGFVQTIDDNHIRFPDYAGNTMFNTMGNLALNPRLGLLFVNYATGDTLQVTGRAEGIEPFHWHNGEHNGHVEVLVEQVIRTTGGALGQWRFGEFSPYNP